MSLFQGRMYDPETGLYYYRARYYSPELKRFLQPDPMGYTDSMNPYQSFNQNPANFTDPMGLLISIDANYGALSPDSEELKKIQRTNLNDNVTIPTLLRIAEGGANMVLGGVYWLQDIGSCLSPGAALAGTETNSRFRFNFSEPGSILGIDISERTQLEKLKEMSIIIPVGEFVGDFSGNLIMGYLDDYYATQSIGKEVRENLDRQIIPMAALVYGGVKSISKQPNYVEVRTTAVKDSLLPQIIKNKVQGDAFENIVRNILNETQKDVVQQITIKTRSNIQTRVDFIGKDKNTNTVTITEAKSSLNAPLTPNQHLTFPEIELFGGIVAGKGKFPFNGGFKIPPIKVKIIRKQ